MNEFVTIQLITITCFMSKLQKQSNDKKDMCLIYRVTHGRNMNTTIILFPTNRWNMVEEYSYLLFKYDSFIIISLKFLLGM